MALKNMLSTSDAMKVRGCTSRTTIWSDVRAGRFPKPVIFRGRKYWYVDELEEWQLALPRGQGRQFFTRDREDKVGGSPRDPPT